MPDSNLAYLSLVDLFPELHSGGSTKMTSSSSPNEHSEVPSSMTSSSSLNEGHTAKIQANDLPITTPKLTPQALKYETIFLVYKGYLKLPADAQDDNLENLKRLCLRFNQVPSIDTVNWLIQEANIIDEKHRLNFAIYPFMQEFKFLMGATGGNRQPRLFVGTLTFSNGKTEVWAGWPKTARETWFATTDKTELYDAPEDENGQTLALDLSPAWRQRIAWDEPLEELFQMSKILNGRHIGKAAQVQDAILLSVAKVVIRFPGLMRAAPDAHDRRGRISIVSSKFSQRPFHDREPESPDSPFLEAFRKLNYGPDPAKSVHRCHPPDSDNFIADIKASDSKASNQGTPYWAPKSGLVIKKKSEQAKKRKIKRLAHSDIVSDTDPDFEPDSEPDLSPPLKKHRNTP